MGENSLNSREKGSVVERLRGYLDSMVEVHLLDEQIIRGRLVQIDEDLVNIFIEDCIDLAGRTSPAAVVMGSSISHINILSLPSFETIDEQVFELVQKNGEMSVNEIAKMLDAKPSSVKSAISRLRKNGLFSPKERIRKGTRR